LVDPIVETHSSCPDDPIGDLIDEYHCATARLARCHETLLDKLNTNQENKTSALIGESPAMQLLRRQIEAVAKSDATVLVLGETGTGKELVSAEIHRRSERSHRPYLCVNCAALSAGSLERDLFGLEQGAFPGAEERRKGRFELASGGTILLDEISELDINLQSKLLRVLQEKEFEPLGSQETVRVDVRVIATTHRNLETEVREGRLRPDLYFRLAIVPIEVPPLRERKEDISLLAAVFLERFAAATGKWPLKIDVGSLRRLVSYHWPGNVRQLESLVRREVLLAEEEEVTLEINPEKEFSCLASSPDLGAIRGMSIEEVERLLIADTLELLDGHQKHSAEVLGIGVRTLRDKIKKWGLKGQRR